jgi:chromosome segregation ATPase
VFYQGQDKRLPSGGLSGEKMRAIYNELGRRQVSIHTLSVSLAQSNSEVEALRLAYNNHEEAMSSLTERNQELEVHIEDLHNQLLEHEKNTDTLRSVVEKVRECNESLVDDAKRTSEKYHKDILDLNNQCRLMERNAVTYKQQVDNLERENFKLTEQLKSLTLEVKHRESMQNLAEQRLEVETRAYGDEVNELLEKIKNMESEVMEINQTKNDVRNISQSNNELKTEVSNLKDELSLEKKKWTKERAEFQDTIDMTTFQLKNTSAQLQSALLERDEALTALKRAMVVVKELNEKLQTEFELRRKIEEDLIEREAELQALSRAKERINFAVLDALHKERSRNLALGGGAVSSTEKLQEFSSAIRIHSDQLSPSSDTNSNTNEVKYSAGSKDDTYALSNQNASPPVARTPLSYDSGMNLQSLSRTSLVEDLNR